MKQLIKKKSRNDKFLDELTKGSDDVLKIL